MRILTLTCALGLAGALAARTAGAADFSVGAGSDCSHHSIAEALQQAAQTPEADTIRLANDQPYTDQIVDIGTSVNLTGGYAHCADPAPVGHTLIDGTDGWATMIVFGGDPTNSIEVHIQGLDITGGGASDIGYVGGLVADGRALVYVADTSLHDNVGINGGGLGVLGEHAIVTLERNVDIHANRSSVGGGVYVERGTLRVRPQNVVVRDNRAIDGGGVAIVGGLVSVSSDIDDTSTPIDGFRITGNEAFDAGGGVYVGGVWGSLLADDTIVADNTAASEGGGIFATDDGYAQFARNTMGPFRHCPAELECLRISGNTAARGGALALRNGANGHLAGTLVRDNTAVGAPAFAIHGETSELRTFGSVVAANPCAPTSPGCDTIGMTGGRVRFTYTTFADNAGGEPLIVAVGAEGATATDIQMYSSLVAGKPRLFDFDNASLSVRLDCVIKDQGIPDVTAERSEVAPIVFQNAAQGNYRLAAGNRAIDYCDAANAQTEDPDPDGVVRGVDAPEQVDNLGPYDLGAYEYVEVAVPDDTIFAGGFELP